MESFQLARTHQLQSNDKFGMQTTMIAEPRAALRRMISVVYLMLLVGLHPLAAHAAQSERVALLIGNATYAAGPLRNPQADVRAMEAALHAVGFKVETVMNANQNQMKRAVRDFGERAQGVDIAFLYYSGHGTQANGENYLIPIHADINKESDYEVEAVSANALMRQIAGARPRAAIVVLDACRDNPYVSFTRGGPKGLGRMEAPTGTMIAFATAPNATASDDGLYARVLAAQIKMPGVELLDVFRNTTAEVRRLSGNKQEPRLSEVSITDRIYLATAGAAIAASGQPTALASIKPEPALRPWPPDPAPAPQPAPASVSLISAAGASGIAPLLAKWSAAYAQAGGATVNYASTNSLLGVRQLKAGTIDFALADAPAKTADLEADGLVQFPVAIGSVVIVVNLDGVSPGRLKLSGQVLADIYLGKIHRWNAPEIANLNPGLPLPANEITVIHRADAAGATFAFTDYLSKVSKEFRSTIGAASAVRWVVGVGAKGNAGAVATVDRLKSSIAYMGRPFARGGNLSYVTLMNRDGNYVRPERDNVLACLKDANRSGNEDLARAMTDAGGADSWPICVVSYVLLRATPTDPAKSREVLKFLDWAYRNGGDSDQDYIPIPAEYSMKIESAWAARFKGAAGDPLW
ncbi:MAG: phosphate ABC transporter substrate-binding protein PstS [Pseudomonadota bacterium]